jgi:hypothetical protein
LDPVIIEETSHRRAGRWGLWLAAVGLAGLAVYGAAYWLTVEPSPRIRVLWRPGVPADQRTALERKYLLRNGRESTAEGSVAYDLLDTSPGNIRALVEDTAVVDTTDINRDAYTIPFSTEYGSDWMWMAHRLPGVREAEVRSAVVAALSLLATAGVIVAWRSAHRKQGNSSGPNVPVG